MSFTESDHHDRVWAEIDLGAIESNLRNMHDNLRPGTRMCAVIKADGYGHGALRIARHLEHLDYVWGFALATFEEALELREGGITKPLLLLSYAFPYCYDDLARLGIRPALFRADELEQLSAAAARTGCTIYAHIPVDTAMSRVGIRPDEEGLAFVRKAMETPWIEIEGIFTHFSKADETDTSNSDQQLQVFTAFCDRIEAQTGRRIPIRHSSNSAGTVRFREANMDMVRPGITLYGLWPSEEVPRDIVSLKPALSLYAHVTMVKTIPAGTSVSYGGTWTADKTTTIATIPVGYGDGYCRGLSNKGTVLIRGQRAPIRGRVCMDQLMVDVTEIPGVREGDVATLIGRDGDDAITMEELGDLSGRFNYEFACCLGQRIPRRYVDMPDTARPCTDSIS